MVNKGRQNKGEKQRSAKLTEIQVKEILESDELQQVLADQYGVYNQTISKIKRGDHWKHIKGKRHIGNTYVNNQTGVRGVYPYKGKFRAQINLKKKRYYLGTFETIAKAEQALNKWKERHEQRTSISPMAQRGGCPRDSRRY